MYFLRNWKTPHNQSGQRIYTTSFKVYDFSFFFCIFLLQSTSKTSFLEPLKEEGVAFLLQSGQEINGICKQLLKNLYDSIGSVIVSEWIFLNKILKEKIGGKSRIKEKLTLDHLKVEYGSNSIIGKCSFLLWLKSKRFFFHIII